MLLDRSTVGLSLISLVALLGLGGCPKETTSDATEDPLTGDWNSSSCFGTATKPADVETCKTTLSFKKDLDFELKAEWISLAAAKTTPGCTTIKRVTGQEWSTDRAAGTFTISDTGQATAERTKCVDEKDNQKPTPTSDISVRPGKYNYTLNDKTLNIDSGPLEGAYTR